MNEHQAGLGHPIALKPETLAAIDAVVQRYPVAEAALIPVMHLVQDDLDWLPIEALDWVAEKLSLPEPRVYGVASFYTMFRRKPGGKVRLEICTNLSCSLMGGAHLRDHLCRRLGIAPGQTTADGLITLTEVECLGSCGTAPVMLVNDQYYENLDPKKIDALLMRIEAGRDKAKAGGHG